MLHEYHVTTVFQGCVSDASLAKSSKIDSFLKYLKLLCHLCILLLPGHPFQTLHLNSIRLLNLLSSGFGQVDRSDLIVPPLVVAVVSHNLLTLQSLSQCLCQVRSQLFETFPCQTRLVWAGTHTSIPFCDQPPLSRPNPEAGHGRDVGCQPRYIQWGGSF